MSPGEIISLSGVSVVGIGLVLTWIRNGRSTSEKYGILLQKVEQTNQRLDRHESKLDAIQDTVNEQKVNCATISGSLKGKIEALEAKEK